MSSHGTYPPVRPPASAEAPTTTIFSGGTVSGGVTSHDQLNNVRFDQHAHSVQQHPDIVAATPSDGWVLTAQVDGITGQISYTFQAPTLPTITATDPYPQYAFAQHGHQYDDIQELNIALPTYSASITPDATAGLWQTIVVTNNTAFTINAPTNPPPATLTRGLVMEVSNTSGGAMGAITWNAAFVLVGGAFTNPANTKKRFLSFMWNGTKWIELSRAGADY